MSQTVMVNRLLLASGIALGMCYAIHLCGPLRVVDDGPLFLVGASDLASGLHYHDRRMPRGYPQALATLEFLGLNSSAGIVGLNLISMAMGMVLVSSVLRREMGLSGRACATCLLLCGLSWVWIYLAPVPMSDMLFFWLSSAVPGGSIGNETRFGMGCVAAFRGPLSQRRRVLRANDRRRVFAAVAFSAIEVVSQKRGRRAALVALFAGSGIAAVIGLVFYRSLVTPGYEQDWRNIFFSVGRANIPYWRVAEIGEMFQNVSARAFIPKSYSLSIESVSPNEFVTAELEAIRYAFGIMAAALILFGALRHKRLSYVEVYLASYTTILMLWPFTDVRFGPPCCLCFSPMAGLD